MPITVITRLTITKGKEAEFETIMKGRFSGPSAKGSRGYRLLRSHNNPQVYLQVGFWGSKEERERLSKQHGPLQQIIGKTGPVLAKTPVTAWYEVAAEKDEGGELRFYGTV